MNKKEGIKKERRRVCFGERGGEGQCDGEGEDTLVELQILYSYSACSGLIGEGVTDTDRQTALGWAGLLRFGRRGMGRWDHTALMDWMMG